MFSHSLTWVEAFSPNPCTWVKRLQSLWGAYEAARSELSYGSYDVDIISAVQVAFTSGIGYILLCSEQCAKQQKMEKSRARRRWGAHLHPMLEDRMAFEHLEQNIVIRYVSSWMTQVSLQLKSCCPRLGYQGRALVFSRIFSGQFHIHTFVCTVKGLGCVNLVPHGPNVGTLRPPLSSMASG